ncbi:hypothetical protein AVEN_259595-1, partial [Araneus ventricosus]
MALICVSLEGKPPVASPTTASNTVTNMESRFPA